MIAESKYDLPLQFPPNRSVCEIIAKSPNLLKTHLAYFLSITIKNNDINLLNYLLTADTSNNQKVWNEFLLQCVELGKCNMITLLLQKGRNSNVQNEYGETPLHIAASKGDYETAKILHMYKANCFIKTKENLTPYDYAIEQGDKRVINLLNIQKNNSMIVEDPERDDDNTKPISTNDKFNAKTTKYCDMPCQINLNKYSNKQQEKNSKELFDKSSSSDPECEKEQTEFKYENIKDDKIVMNSPKTNRNNISITRDQSNTQEFDKTHESGINKKYLQQSKGMTKESNKNYEDLFYFPTVDHRMNSSVIKEEDYDQVTPRDQSDNDNNDLKQDDDDLLKTLPLELNENNKLNSPFFTGISKDQQGSNSSNIDTYPSHNQKISFEKNSISQSNNNLAQSQTNDEVFVFLNEIKLSQYTELLIKNGFDDINLIIDQTKRSLAITDKNLSEAGITLPGDRAKILIHLEEKAKLFEFDIKKDSVYYKPNKMGASMNKSDSHILNLYRLLSSIKMESFLDNFVNAGYPSSDLILVQMLSRQPLTEQTLLNDIGIDKIGYRARILTKFKEEASNYILKIRNRNLVIDSPKNSNEFCNCFIY